MSPRRTGGLRPQNSSPQTSALTDIVAALVHGFVREAIAELLGLPKPKRRRAMRLRLVDGGRHD